MTLFENQEEVNSGYYNKIIRYKVLKGGFSGLLV